MSENNDRGELETIIKEGLGVYERLSVRDYEIVAGMGQGIERMATPLVLAMAKLLEAEAALKQAEAHKLMASLPKES